MVYMCIPYVCVSLQDELSLAGYRRHLESQKAAPPLSQTEVALQELQLNEVRATDSIHLKMNEWSNQSGSLYLTVYTYCICQEIS